MYFESRQEKVILVILFKLYGQRELLSDELVEGYNKSVKTVYNWYEQADSGKYITPRSECFYPEQDKLPDNFSIKDALEEVKEFGFITNDEYAQIVGIFNQYNLV